MTGDRPGWFQPSQAVQRRAAHDLAGSRDAPSRRFGKACLMGLRCLIVDDNDVFLASAQRLLQTDGLEVVGVATTSAEALRLAADLRPEVVLVDVELGGEDGFALAKQLAEELPLTRVVLISTYPEEDVADLIVASPASAFLPKSRLSAAAVRAFVD
jgi:DNA-binding NarL/FixJ family response regulator